MTTRRQVITIRQSATGFVAKPAAHLGRDFMSYLGHCRSCGLKFDAAEKVQLGTLDQLPDLVRGLTASGFSMDIEDALADKLDERAAGLHRKEQRAVNRLAEAERELAERGLTLYPFQRDGVRWLAPRQHALLADEMGLGKTVQAIMAVEPDAAVLVISPAAAKGNWANEITRWRDDLTPTTLKGRKSFRWPVKGEAVITNWDILPDDCDPAPKGVYIIADECHAAKNRIARRTRRFRELSKKATAAEGHVWRITGTPMLNDPQELWNILDIGSPMARRAFRSWPNFLRLFHGTPGRFGGMTFSGYVSPEVPTLLKRVMLSRRRVEVLPDLPTKTRTDIPVNGLDRATKQLCDQAVEALKAEGVNLDEVDDIVEITRIQGAPFQLISRARAALAVAKAKALIDEVETYEANGEPLVVFGKHKAAVNIIGKRDGWALITGDTSQEDRTEIVKRFQAGELKGVAGTIGAMGVALTLTHAHHLVFIDLDWTPALNQQAEDRICRIGQDRGCIIKRLVANHALDIRVLEILTRKQLLIEKSVEAAAISVGEVEEHDGADSAAARADADLVRGVEKVKAKPKKAAPARRSGRWVAETDEEREAADRVCGLAHDGDFEDGDARFGAGLVKALRDGDGLSALQWAGVKRLAKKYGGAS